MNISPFFFATFSITILVCSLFVVFKENPITNAFNLILVFINLAGLYALMDAHLLASLQVLIYAGAVMVLFMFVIMLLNSDSHSIELFERSPKKSFFIHSIIGILSLLLVGLLLWSFREAHFRSDQGIFSTIFIEKNGGNTLVLSELLFSEYALPFELSSILLLSAIVGVVSISKRNLKQGGSS